MRYASDEDSCSPSQHTAGTTKLNAPKAQCRGWNRSRQVKSKDRIRKSTKFDTHAFYSPNVSGMLQSADTNWPKFASR